MDRGELGVKYGGITKEELDKVCRKALEDIAKTEFDQKAVEVVREALDYIIKKPLLFEGCKKPNMIRALARISRFCIVHRCGKDHEDVEPFSLKIAEIAQHVLYPRSFKEPLINYKM